MSAKKQGFAHESFANVSVEWYTPPWIFERLGLPSIRINYATRPHGHFLKD